MANALHFSRSINHWTKLKKVKLEKTKISSSQCRTGFGYFYDQTILDLVTAFETQLNVTSTELRFTNISSEYLETAAEMFIYLIICPRGTENWYDGWFEFNRDLLETESLGTIILTLNRILKTRSNTEDREIVQKLLTTFTSLTNFTSLNYKEIQRMLLENTGNTSSDHVKGMLYYTKSKNDP